MEESLRHVDVRPPMVTVGPCESPAYSVEQLQVGRPPSLGRDRLLQHLASKSHHDTTSDSDRQFKFKLETRTGGSPLKLGLSKTGPGACQWLSGARRPGSPAPAALRSRRKPPASSCSGGSLLPGARRPESTAPLGAGGSGAIPSQRRGA